MPARASVPGGRYHLIPDRSRAVGYYANRPNRIDEGTYPQFEPHQVFRGAALRFVLPATVATLRWKISDRSNKYGQLNRVGSAASTAVFGFNVLVSSRDDRVRLAGSGCSFIVRPA